MVTPDQASIGATVTLSGQVPPALAGKATITVVFAPDGPHRDVADTSQTGVHTVVSPALWIVRPDATGRFSLAVSVPEFVEVGDGGALWQIEAGPHHFVLSTDRDHTTSANILVLPGPPVPTAVVPP